MTSDTRSATTFCARGQTNWNFSYLRERCTFVTRSRVCSLPHPPPLASPHSMAAKNLYIKWIAQFCATLRGCGSWFEAMSSKSSQRSDNRVQRARQRQRERERETERGLDTWATFETETGNWNCNLCSSHRRRHVAHFELAADLLPLPLPLPLLLPLLLHNLFRGHSEKVNTCRLFQWAGQTRPL